MTLALTTELDAHAAEFLSLELEVSRDYNLFVYRDSEQAAGISRYLYERGRIEFSPPHGRALIDGDRLVGMVACLSGAELSACRLRIVLELKKSGVLEKEPQMARRLQLAGQIFVKPKKTDFYLSRIAVIETARQRGLGSFLLEAYENQGIDLNCDRFVFEVVSSNDTAIAFYRRHGYREIDRRRAHDPESDRSLEYLHMAKNNERAVRSSN